jgi:hypothetical protein
MVKAVRVTTENHFPARDFLDNRKTQQMRNVGGHIRLFQLIVPHATEMSNMKSALYSCDRLNSTKVGILRTS